LHRAELPNSPKKALDDPMSITGETGLPALTHANLLAAAIERLDERVNALDDG
jgi:hypothetical protein